MSEKNTIQSSINILLNTGAVSEVQPCKSQYISKIFLVPKPDGSHRLILNLKSLNKFIWNAHFKLEDYRTVTKMLHKNYFMATLDLKDAYHMIPIFKSHKKYLRFSFNNKLYQYNCMPFGLNCAPLIFTKLMKPVLSFLRNKGFLSVLYLDDFLLLGSSFSDCVTNVNVTVQLVEKLGFIVNFKKSHLQPSQSVTYLGFVYNTKNMSISLPIKKTKRVVKLLNRFSTLQVCSIRDFAKFLGVLTSICPAVKFSWLYTKLFERQKFLALRKSAGNYNAKMHLPPLLFSDFQWWLHKLPQAQNNIRVDSYILEIFSDASMTGWGACANNKKCHGFWTETESRCHINILELKAAFYALKYFTEKMSNCNILCRIDNTTAVAYINKMGSVQYPTLNALSRTIWQWCEQRNIYIFASYITSKDNYVADAESRVELFKETEWELSSTAFQDIVRNFGQPIIDFFATKHNSKCKKFVSWMRSPGCWAVDAFTLNWKQQYFYAFPPFTLILRVLNKIIEDKARGIVVVPRWSSQPWYPLFCSLLEEKPLIFDPDKNLLSFSGMPHPLWPKTTLVAGILSCKH